MITEYIRHRYRCSFTLKRRSRPSELLVARFMSDTKTEETVRGNWKIVYTRRRDPNGFHYVTEVLHEPTGKVVKKLEGSDIVTKFGEHESGRICRSSSRQRKMVWRSSSSR